MTNLILEAIVRYDCPIHLEDTCYSLDLESRRALNCCCAVCKAAIEELLQDLER